MDILDLIDNALADVTSCDAMRWSPVAGTIPVDLDTWIQPQAQLPYVVDGARPGCALVPFVGGPCHRDLRAMPRPLASQYNVLPLDWMAAAWLPGPGLVEPPVPIIYYLRRIGSPQAWTIGEPVVYAVPNATQRELTEALLVAYDAGWRP